MHNENKLDGTAEGIATCIYTKKMFCDVCGHWNPDMGPYPLPTCAECGKTPSLCKCAEYKKASPLGPRCGAVEPAAPPAEGIDNTPWMDYEDAGKEAYAEERVIVFRAKPTGQKFAAHPDGSYASLTRPVEPAAPVVQPAKQKMKDEWEPDAAEWMQTIRGLLFTLGMKEEMSNWRGDFKGWGAAFEWIKYHVKRSQAIPESQPATVVVRTPRPHQRAHGDVQRGFVSCYAQDEADAYMDHLEQQIAVLSAHPTPLPAEEKQVDTRWRVERVEYGGAIAETKLLEESDARQLYANWAKNRAFYHDRSVSLVRIDTTTTVAKQTPGREETR